MKGNFVIQKTARKFSGVAHDQVHEQLNAVVKGDGGIVGITENDDHTDTSPIRTEAIEGKVYKVFKLLNWSIFSQ